MADNSFWPVTAGIALSGLLWVAVMRTPPLGTFVLLPLVWAFYAGRATATPTKDTPQ